MSLYHTCKLHLTCNENAETTAVADAMGLASPVAARFTSLMHTAGRSGGAFHFDGVNDSIQIPYAAEKNDVLGLEYNETDEWSIALRVKTTATSGMIVSHVHYTDTLKWGVAVESDGRISFFEHIYKLMYVSVCNDGLWHDVVFTLSRDMDNETVVGTSWLDGVLQDTYDLSTRLLWQMYGYAMYPPMLYVGAQSGYPPHNLFSGDIDCLSIFNTALSAAEVAYLHEDETETILHAEISAITEAAGVISLTLTGDGDIDIYSRLAGTATWTLSAESQTAGVIAISGLTAGAAYSFYAVARSGGQDSGPSNIMSVYLHDETAPTIVNVEAWAVGLLADLGVFKTVGTWMHQVWRNNQGDIEGVDKLAPFAFISEEPSGPDREGGYDLNRKIKLCILVGQKSLADGAARTGDSLTVGTVELRDLIIAALEKANPGNGFDCDDFYYTGCYEVFDSKRKHLVEMTFEANWLPTE